MASTKLLAKQVTPWLLRVFYFIFLTTARQNRQAPAPEEHWELCGRGRGCDNAGKKMERRGRPKHGRGPDPGRKGSLAALFCVPGLAWVVFFFP